MLAVCTPLTSHPSRLVSGVLDLIRRIRIRSRPARKLGGNPGSERSFVAPASRPAGSSRERSSRCGPVLGGHHPLLRASAHRVHGYVSSGWLRCCARALIALWSGSGWSPPTLARERSSRLVTFFVVAS